MTRPDRRAVAATAVGRLTANEPARFTPGDFRREQNWIGGRLDSPMDAPFIPPPEDEVAALLEPYEERIAAAA